MNYTARRP